MSDYRDGNGDVITAGALGKVCYGEIPECSRPESHMTQLHQLEQIQLKDFHNTIWKKMKVITIHFIVIITVFFT